MLIESCHGFVGVGRLQDVVALFHVADEGCWVDAEQEVVVLVMQIGDELGGDCRLKVVEAGMRGV